MQGKEIVKESRVNIHVYPSPFRHESRMLKETKSIADSGLVDKVVIGAVWERGLEKFEKIDDKREVHRIPLRTSKLPNNHMLTRVIKLIEWQIRLFLMFKMEPVFMFNCHNLASLPVGIAFKLFLKSKLIYDTHELETERSGWPFLVRMVARQFESLMIRFVDITFVVSDSIAAWYRKTYSLSEVHVLKNFPYYHNNHDVSDRDDSLKRRFKIQDDELLFIYQGTIDKGRGIELLLNAFSKVDKKKHIVFMGFMANDLLWSKIKEYERTCSNVHVQPAVRPQEVLNYTKSADVGLYLIQDTCMSYRLTVGNKVYEYIASGLPIIASDFPDVGKIIDEYDCGWKVSANAGAILDLLDKISKEAVEEKRRNTIKCRDKFNWSIEAEKMLKVYDRILGKTQQVYSRA